MVIELQHHIRRPLCDEPRVSKNLHIVEDEGLVPGGVQSRPQLLRRLAEVQEGNVCVRICEKEKNKVVFFPFKLLFKTFYINLIFKK